MRSRPLALALSACVAALSACSAGTPPAAAPAAASGSAAVQPDLSAVQLTTGLSHDHRPGRLTYSTTPPVGGAHDAAWLRCEVYDAPVPNEFAVHSEEHGAVWLTYRPGLPADQVAQLAALRETSDVTREYVLVSPYEGLPSPVVAATWGASLAVPSAGDPRLAAFVAKYAGGGQGGERGVPCTSAANALTPAQARALLAQQAQGS